MLTLLRQFWGTVVAFWSEPPTAQSAHWHVLHKRRESRVLYNIRIQMTGCFCHFDSHGTSSQRYSFKISKRWYHSLLVRWPQQAVQELEELHSPLQLFSNIGFPESNLGLHHLTWEALDSQTPKPVQAVDWKHTCQGIGIFPKWKPVSSKFSRISDLLYQLQVLINYCISAFVWNKIIACHWNLTFFYIQTYQ